MVANMMSTLPSTEILPDEVDDYMSMAILEPSKPLEKETYTQRRIRKVREAEARSRPKSKVELAAAADAARDNALYTSLPATSKGFQMMVKLGFKPGSALGAPSKADARTEPLGIEVKEGKAGLGMENEKKRKFREEATKMEGMEKKQKAEEGDYRERVAREREDQRVEGQWWRAMRVLEGLEQPDDRLMKVPLKNVNVLWRGLVKDRVEKERERRARYDMNQGLTRNQHNDDPEADEQDRQAWGKEEEKDLEAEDGELDEFLALEGKYRLRRVADYLRAEYFYCFWCKSKFEDHDMDGCPGSEEGDHD